MLNFSHPGLGMSLVTDVKTAAVSEIKSAAESVLVTLSSSNLGW